MKSPSNLKHLKNIAVLQKNLIEKLFSLCEWSLDANKKIMRTETNNWYLKWKVDYLEKKIRQHFKKNGPLAEERPMENGLYHDAPELYEKLKQDGIKENEESE